MTAHTSMPTVIRWLPAQVLVRAFGDEPVQLTAISYHDRVIDVVGADASAPVSFPRAFVLEYDAKLYARLKAAYDAHNTKLLLELWAEARPLKIYT